MKPNNLLTALTLLSVLSACSVPEDGCVRHPADHVSTLVGTLSDPSFSTGNTYPAVALPWGMNFWTPQTGPMGDGWTYSYASRHIRGLKQTHQPSPWINDYGQFSLMPVTGREAFDEDSRRSCFSHRSETARPFYYSVYLADHDVLAEMAPTERAAVMRFTFPRTDEAGIVVDAFDGESMIRILDSCTVAGYSTRNSGGVPDNFRNWFVLRTDTPFGSVEVSARGGSPDRRTVSPRGCRVEGSHALARLNFRTCRGQQVTVQVASSFISEEQAFRNLREVGGDGLDAVAEKARNRWNEVLGRIAVGGGTADQYRTFYSCLYRATLFPRKFYELDAGGRPVHYSPYNGEVRPGYLYTDTGFWDTFRALFPLLNLVYPSVNAEIQAGLANAFRESGFLPEWASPGHRDCMIGNNSASVVADAILKGITPAEDVDCLYRALLHGRQAVHPRLGSVGRLGHEFYNRLGYVPCDAGIRESAARTLEYAYDDWCISRVALALGDTATAAELEEAAGNYARLYDPEHRLMRGRESGGGFQSPFSPYKWGGVFTEGNAWHYTWSVFHDVEGLARLMGGREKMAEMLDSVFVVPPVYDDSYYGYRIHEITEMQVAAMGNYAHGNQPAQHMIYLYNYCGRPWSAQWWVREVMDRLYAPGPDGYCGDEDNGQTSAWYVFSALGFYPVCPGSGEYVLGSPLFRKAVVTLEGGRRIVIRAENNSGSRRYIRRLEKDGEEYGLNWLRHEDLCAGTVLDFDMGEEPEMSRGRDTVPYSLSGAGRL